MIHSTYKKYKSMKRIVLMAAIACLALGANAQKVTKPSDGTFGLELQMNPFDQNGKTFSLDGLKMRYFFNSENALRAKIGFDVTKDKVTRDAGNSDDPDPYTSKTTGSFKFDVGYERHFDLGERFDAYVGGEVGVVRGFAKTKDFDDDDNWTKTKNADGANVGFHVAALTGVDFYVYKSLYIGAELSLGVESTVNKQSETTTKADGKEITTKGPDVKDRTTTAGISVQPVLRLGWNF